MSDAKSVEELKKNVSKNEMSIFKSKVIECFFFILFMVLTIIMYIYHEPWYDEIQAWMVASDASVGEMIWHLPHYEGHPPFWTLLLALFAKTGVPMEIGLRIPAFLFSSAAAGVVIFKAPFKKWIRCLIPFTYFLLGFGALKPNRCINLLPSFCSGFTTKRSATGITAY